MHYAHEHNAHSIANDDDNNDVRTSKSAPQKRTEAHQRPICQKYSLL